MNLFYEVWGNGKNLPDKEIDLFIGDEKIKSEIGRFEALFIINEENQIKKMECIFLLRVPGINPYSIPHPAVVYVNLPQDLLNKASVYKYTMSLTNSNFIYEISNFKKYFNNDQNEPQIEIKYFSGRDSGVNFDKEVEKMTIKDKKRTLAIMNCENVYETIELPKISKFRCRKAVSFTGTEKYGTEGMLFNFSTSIPSILNNIIYNTLTECQIEQFHGGEGDNKK